MVTHWPENDEEPGSGQEYLQPHDYVHMLLTFLRDNFHRPPASVGLSTLVLAEVVDETATLADDLLGATEQLEEIVPRVISGISGTLVHDFEKTSLHAAHTLFGRIRKVGDADSWEGDLQRRVIDGICTLLKHFQDSLDAMRDSLADDPQLLNWYFLLVNGVATARGMLCEDVLRQGFGVLEQYDLREFLARYDASPEALDCALVRGGYDYVFAFKKGNIKKPSFAAGTAIRGALRVFLTYKGALMWKMNAGMGDTIFTPYYKILKHRGVKFEFFTKVKNLGVDDQGRIDTIDIERQATLKDATKGYRPLRRVRDLDCWPDRPDYDQLVEGNELRDEKINLESFWTPWSGKGDQLRLGHDFDDVILGIAPGAFPHICAELNSKPRWAQMVKKTKTVQTLALQLWLKPDLGELGWNLDSPISTSYVENYSTWADMSNLLPAELWEHDVPKNIAYFCGVLKDADDIPPHSDADFPRTQHERVRSSARRWLNDNIAYLWPSSVRANGDFNESLLVQGGSFYRANIDPSERYVLSTPNSTQYRLDAADSGFANLYLAGDWVRTPINAGCVEAATVAGLKAAAGLTRQRIQIDDDPSYRAGDEVPTFTRTRSRRHG